MRPPGGERWCPKDRTRAEAAVRTDVAPSKVAVILPRIQQQPSGGEFDDLVLVGVGSGGGGADLPSLSVIVRIVDERLRCGWPVGSPGTGPLGRNHETAVGRDLWILPLELDSRAGTRFGLPPIEAVAGFGRLIRIVDLTALGPGSAVVVAGADPGHLVGSIGVRILAGGHHGWTLVRPLAVE